MELCTLASGSSGNAVFLGTDETGILIDSGISGKRTEEGLRTIGRTGGDLSAILLTHEHADHVQGLGVLARKLGIPIYATEGTRNAVKRMRSLGEIPDDLFHVVKADEPVQIGELTVSPFSISHDAAEPVGYRVESRGKSAAVATDMGVYTEETIRHLKGLDVLLLEANHDIHMLEVGRYPYYLKMRILGEKGHLSNEASGRLLSEVLHDNMKHILLGHLSKDNNYPALAYETVCAEVTMGDSPYRAGDFPIHVAERDRAGERIIF
ncbi:MAG: MBL fold metallo-hydrolase [Eubacterium sp.]|nr:MBL fold metallo-hydrolase [Eubacterium sp.]